MGKRELLSIVVPTKNRASSLRRLLASLQHQDYQPCEVIVVDDASDAPPRSENGVRVILRETSGGPGPARNDGITASSGAFIAILDDDCEIIDSSLLVRAAEILERYPRCGAVAFTQADASGRPWPAGLQVTRSSVPCYAPQFFGFGALLRGQAMREVGGFALDYYYEEIELSLRLLDAGWSVIHDPSLTIVHHHDWQGRDWRDLNRRILRNTILTAFLRYPAWLVPVVSPCMPRITYGGAGRECSIPTCLLPIQRPARIGPALYGR